MCCTVVLADGTDQKRSDAAQQLKQECGVIMLDARARSGPHGWAPQEASAMCLAEKRLHTNGDTGQLMEEWHAPLESSPLEPNKMMCVISNGTITELEHLKDT